MVQKILLTTTLLFSSILSACDHAICDAAFKANLTAKIEKIKTLPPKNRAWEGFKRSGKNALKINGFIIKETVNFLFEMVENAKAREAYDPSARAGLNWFMAIGAIPAALYNFGYLLAGIVVYKKKFPQALGLAALTLAAHLALGAAVDRWFPALLETKPCLLEANRPLEERISLFVKTADENLAQVAQYTAAENSAATKIEIKKLNTLLTALEKEGRKLLGEVTPGGTANQALGELVVKITAAIAKTTK